MKKLGLLPLLVLPACVEDSVPDGRMQFVDQCQICHGADAKGQGALAPTLPVKPSNLTTIAARNGGVFPRNAVAATIDGLNRGEHPLNVMPEFGAGDMGPLIMTEEDGVPVPIPANLLALVDYLETIQE